VLENTDMLFGVGQKEENASFAFACLLYILLLAWRWIK
jgi:hypothetical protein